MLPLITLLTDFGLTDSYVGVLKGVIAQIAPEAKVIDLTHEIAPQDIASARFTLMTAYSYFPTHTIHVVIVDPGVGTDRRGIAFRNDHGTFVGPDNGVFDGVLPPAIEGMPANPEPTTTVSLTKSRYWRTLTPSTTFHGRDIFAPVAAHLAMGVPLIQIGEPIDPTSLIRLSLPSLQPTHSGWQGTIQAIDHFGNAITTIPGNRITSQSWHVEWTTRHKGATTPSPVNIPGHLTYGDIPRGDWLALIGSHGWVEIAVHGGSAQQHLRLQVGDSVCLCLDSQRLR